MENLDILKILESKSEDSLIKDTKILLKQLVKQEDTQEQIEQLKNDLDKLTENSYHRIKEIYQNRTIDEEKLDFALKLINKDKATYQELEEIKRNYKRQQKLKDLEELKNNTKNTCQELELAINSVKITKEKKKKQTLIKRIKNKIKKNDKEDEKKEQLEKIMQILIDSREPKNMEELSEKYFDLKEEYFTKVQMKQTIDILFKNCREGNTSELQELKKQLRIKTTTVIENIERDIEKLKKENTVIKQYDKRLVEYVYNKQRNYISHSIDHSTEANQMYINILTILKLINELEKGTKIVYKEEDLEPIEKEEKNRIKK